MIKNFKMTWLVLLVAASIWLGLYIIGMLPLKPTFASETFQYYEKGERTILLLMPDKKNEMGKALLRSYYQQGFSVYVAYDTNIEKLQPIFGRHKTLGLVAVEVESISLLNSLAQTELVDMLILVNCSTNNQSLKTAGFSFPILIVYNTWNQNIRLSPTLALYTKLQLEHLLPGQPVYLKPHDLLWHNYETPIVPMVSDCLKFTTSTYHMELFVGWQEIRLWYLFVVLLAVYILSDSKVIFKRRLSAYLK